MSRPLEGELAVWLETQRELARLWAHDLRNPVASILANVNFLELSLPAEGGEALEVLADVRLAAELLLRVVDNVVTASVLEAPGGREEVAQQRTRVRPAIDAVMQRVAPAARAAQVSIHLVYEAMDVSVCGDAVVLECAIENLLANAIQNLRPGRAAELRVESDAAHVRFTLRDDGPPFGPVERDFSREGQLALKTRGDARYSRGLALYLVGLAVRALGGTVRTETDAQHGTVTLEVPTGVVGSDTVPGQQG